MSVNTGNAGTRRESMIERVPFSLEHSGLTEKIPFIKSFCFVESGTTKELDARGHSVLIYIHKQSPNFAEIVPSCQRAKYSFVKNSGICIPLWKKRKSSKIYVLFYCCKIYSMKT